MRLQIVAALKPVDRAFLGHEGNIFEILGDVRPDIVAALGYDQIHDENRIVDECRRRGLSTKVVRLSRSEGDLDGTRKIVKKVGEWLEAQGRLGGNEGAEAPPGVPPGADD